MSYNVESIEIDKERNVIFFYTEDYYFVESIRDLFNLNNIFCELQDVGYGIELTVHLGKRIRWFMMFKFLNLSDFQVQVRGIDFSENIVVFSVKPEYYEEFCDYLDENELRYVPSDELDYYSILVWFNETIQLEMGVLVWD